MKPTRISFLTSGESGHGVKLTTSGEVKNKQSYTSATHVCFNGMGEHYITLTSYYESISWTWGCSGLVTRPAYPQTEALCVASLVCKIHELVIQVFWTICLQRGRQAEYVWSTCRWLFLQEFTFMHLIQKFLLPVGSIAFSHYSHPLTWSSYSRPMSLRSPSTCSYLSKLYCKKTMRLFIVLAWFSTLVLHE